MKYSSVQVTFQEVPNEISLCFLVTGCPLRCPGCHSADSWNADRGTELTLAHLQQVLKGCRSVVTCVCFLGGEWHEEELIEILRWCQSQRLKTCLYTGLEEVSPQLQAVLDYIKVGRYIQERGGLSFKGTNQKFINLKTQEILNQHFQAQGGRNDSTQPNSDTTKNSIRS